MLKKNKINIELIISYIIIAFLALGIIYPLISIFLNSLNNSLGEFIGFSNYIQYFKSQGLFKASLNTLFLGLWVTFISTSLAFLLAYGFMQKKILGATLCNLFCYLPIYVPSLFPALGLIYFFGSQGIFKKFLGSFSIYGFWGLVLAFVIYTLPHALIILSSALTNLNPNLNKAAQTLGASPLKCLFTITIPNIKHSLINAAFVVFIFTITDLALPLVLAGSFSVLSTEIYKQIIGLQNLPMGATVSIILLLPTLFIFFISNKLRKQTVINENIKPLKNNKKNVFLTIIAWLTTIFLLGIMLVVVFGSLIKFWPYNLDFSFTAYSFKNSISGIKPYFNSLKLATLVAFFGSFIIFTGAYLSERILKNTLISKIYKFLAVIPLGIPGTVLGLAFILAFNVKFTPVAYIYGSLAILVFNTIIHLYSVSHFNTLAGLSGLNPNYELVGQTLSVKKGTTFLKVILPLQINNIFNLFFYLFINSLTTISAVIFLYNPKNLPASVNILQIFTSNMAEASAMATLLLLTALTLKILQIFIQKFILKMLFK